MKKVEEIVSDEDLSNAFGYANFGDASQREVVAMAVLKCASGWYQGHTSQSICCELRLISDDYEITQKGREYLWAAFGDPKF